MNASRLALLNDRDEVVREYRDSDLEVLAAAGRHFARFSCLLTSGDDTSVFLGSGTTLRIGQELFIMTGLEESVPVLAWPSGLNERIVISKGVQARGHCDVACLRAEEDSVLHSDIEAVECNRLAFGIRDAGKDLLIVCGNPDTEWQVDAGKKEIRTQPWSVGAISIPSTEWPNAEPEADKDSDLFLYYSAEFGFNSRGEPTPALNPGGLSGGAIWRVPVSIDGKWSPNAAKLIAIQRSVEGREWKWLRATQIQHCLCLVWHKWPDTRDDIRRALPCFESEYGETLQRKKTPLSTLADCPEN